MAYLFTVGVFHDKTYFERKEIFIVKKKRSVAVAKDSVSEMS